ncbi:MAG: DpnD/PcfM family protein [Methylococcales bacterium]|nr:DpnD/PcfM family protein [Methylococcales bacterium]
MSLKKYQIEITETLQRIVEVEAASLDDAIVEIRKQYENEEIILDSSDCVETDISEFKDN